MHLDIRSILIYSYAFLGFFGDAEKNESAFIPTREWQTVKRGTPIPGGLHIRHNFQTGVTEAKLMEDKEIEGQSSNDSNDSHSKSLTLHPDKALPQPDSEDDVKTSKNSNALKYSIEDLKAKLKNLNRDKNRITSDDKSEKDGTKKKFKTYETLKKELTISEVNFTNDAELLQTLFQKFQSHRNAITTRTLTIVEIEDIIDILNNLEYLIHQIDNAHVFMDMEGMPKIISPCLNGTNNEIKAEALRLLGAAVQSNPKVQIKALENEFVQKVLHILSTNSRAEVRSRCLFALSALIRHFPAAQKALIDHGGLEIFGKILADGTMKIQIKVMKLINDLSVERQDIEKIYDTEYREKKKQEYAITKFEEKLIMQKYCQHLTNLFIGSFKQDIVSKDDFNTRNYEHLEVICENMIIVMPVCKYEFKNNKDILLVVMKNVLHVYDISNINITNGDIIKNLVSLIKDLRTAILNIPHDEL